MNSPDGSPRSPRTLRTLSMKSMKSMSCSLVFVSLPAVIILLLMVPVQARAEVSLPPVIGSNMVIQSGEPVTLWGWADNGEKVLLKLGGVVVGSAVGEGKEKSWKIQIPAQKPGPLPPIEVSGSNTLTLTNALAGEVWLCSGQSNMVKTLKKGAWCPYGGVLNEDQEVAAATDNQIRFYVNGKGWELCTPENAPHFSAVGYYFAQKLRSVLKEPVGMIVLAAGGRPAEWFTPERMMAGDADFEAKKVKAKALRDELGAKWEADKKADKEWRQLVVTAKSKGEQVPPRPANQLSAEQSKNLGENAAILDFAFIYNRDIRPVVPFPIKGFVWYQGESNATRGEEYAALMGKLIQGWREDWGKPLPFVMVALAGFGKPEAMSADAKSFPLIREAAMKVSGTVDHVGVISAVDVGDAGNIHPLDKKPVGERAALWALNHVYGEKVVSEGPGFGKVDFATGKAVVPLTSNKEGVVLKSPGGFELAGKDRKFYPAKEELKDGSIEVSSPEVSKPVALRYAFLNFPECSLYNGAGIPALPFRTDDWPLVPATLQRVSTQP
ncbi:MAG: hypothetical protein EBR40_01885 [Proteobacteria bacterium]|nr:hypothetical protein [Pseudomonadota bacterium]